MSKKKSHINPGFRRAESLEYSHKDLLKGLSDNNFAVLAYLISKAESKLSQDQKLVRDILSTSSSDNFSRIIAISGSPGVGKSSFINSLGRFLLNKGKRIAVLPVDPSSSISKGSILGDKTRMEDLTRSENVFIKPMPSSLSLGGMAPSSAVASMICQRAKFDYILLETVGVGQSETEARNISDMFVLLLQAGGGDDLQGIKRGIMELADLFVFTKADGSLKPEAEKSMKQLKQVMGLLHSNNYNWKAKVLSHSSISGDGNQEINDCINDFYEYMTGQGYLQDLRKQQEIQLFKKYSQEMLMRKILSDTNVSRIFAHLESEVISGNISALPALQKLEQSLHE